MNSNVILQMTPKPNSTTALQALRLTSRNLSCHPGAWKAVKTIPALHQRTWRPCRRVAPSSYPPWHVSDAVWRNGTFPGQAGAGTGTESDFALGSTKSRPAFSRDSNSRFPFRVLVGTVPRIFWDLGVPGIRLKRTRRLRSPSFELPSSQVTLESRQ